MTLAEELNALMDLMLWCRLINDPSNPGHKWAVVMAERNLDIEDAHAWAKKYKEGLL